MRRRAKRARRPSLALILFYDGEHRGVPRTAGGDKPRHLRQVPHSRKITPSCNLAPPSVLFFCLTRATIEDSAFFFLPCETDEAPKLRNYTRQGMSYLLLLYDRLMGFAFHQMLNNVSCHNWRRQTILEGRTLAPGTT